MHDPWGIRGLRVYDYSSCSALKKENVDITLITNFYYEFNESSNFQIKRYFFKYSEKIKLKFIRKFIRGIEYCLEMIYLFKIYKEKNPEYMLYFL